MIQMPPEFLSDNQQHYLSVLLEKYLRSKKTWFGNVPEPLLDEAWLNAIQNDKEINTWNIDVEIYKGYVRNLFADRGNQETIRNFFDKGNIFSNIIDGLQNLFVFQDAGLERIKENFVRMVATDQKNRLQLNEDLVMAMNLQAVEDLELQHPIDQDQDQDLNFMEEADLVAGPEILGIEDGPVANPEIPVEEESIVLIASLQSFAEEMYRDECGRVDKLEERIREFDLFQKQERMRVAGELKIGDLLDENGRISEDLRAEEYGRADVERKREIIVNVAKFNKFIIQQNREIEIKKHEIDVIKKGFLDEGHLGNLAEMIGAMGENIENQNIEEFYGAALAFYISIMNSGDSAEELDRMLSEDANSNATDKKLAVLIDMMRYGRIWNNHRGELTEYETYALGCSLLGDMDDSEEERYKQFNRVKGPLLRRGVSRKNISISVEEDAKYLVVIDSGEISIESFIEQARTCNADRRQEAQNEELKVGMEDVGRVVEVPIRDIAKEEAVENFNMALKAFVGSVDAKILTLQQVVSNRQGYAHIPDAHDLADEMIKKFEALKNPFLEIDTVGLSAEQINGLTSGISIIQPSVESLEVNLRKNSKYSSTFTAEIGRITREVGAVQESADEILSRGRGFRLDKI